MYQHFLTNQNAELKSKVVNMTLHLICVVGVGSKIAMFIKKSQHLTYTA